MSEWIISTEDIDDITGGGFTVGQKLVRCEDCEHWNPVIERDNAVNGLCYGFEFLLFVTPKDGFCFKGDKRIK